MTETATSPFAGLKRKRLPGIHLVTALDGGVPLVEALAAFFFTMLHDKYPHTCLIKQAAKDVESTTQEAIQGASSLDGMFMGSLFGSMASSDLAGEEWSYLPFEEISLLQLMARAAVEHTQRWIFNGAEKPYSIHYGDIVERPAWAEAFLNDLSIRAERVQEARDYVERLRQEIEQEG